jgi:hypothetical protein
MIPSGGKLGIAGAAVGLGLAGVMSPLIESMAPSTVGSHNA